MTAPVCSGVAQAHGRDEKRPVPLASTSAAPVTSTTRKTYATEVANAPPRVATRPVSREKSPMVRTTAVRGLALLIPLLLAGAQVAADNRPGKHMHDDKAPSGKTAGDHGHTTEGHTHQHPWWETPPAEYANAHSTRWGDAAAVARGQQLYQTNCLMCHGADGKGTGPSAKSLPHAPADLTHHFHRAPGDGDAYLFWRVSEGGQVEPFKSSQSAMPAYKTVLSEDQRWDVLAYVHAE